LLTNEAFSCSVSDVVMHISDSVVGI